MDWTEKANLFCSNVVRQFVSRTEVEGKKRGLDFGISLQAESRDGSAWFTFSKGDEAHSFNVPLAFVENNVLLLEQNEVRRAVCPYLMRQEDVILDYYAVMQRVIKQTTRMDSCYYRGPNEIGNEQLYALLGQSPSLFK